MTKESTIEQEFIHPRNERMQYFFDCSHEALIFHIDGIITDTNPALTKMSGFSADEIIGSSVFKWITPQFHELVKINMAKGDEHMYEIALTHKSGADIPVYLRPVNAVVEGKHERLVVIQEIRDLKQAQQTQLQTEAQIHQLSNFDSHTGLPNLKSFNQQLKSLCKNHRDKQQRFSVVHISIKRMKMFNEIFGRSIGDQLLNQWANRLCETLSNTPNHLAARISGIGFAIALPYSKDTNSVVSLLHKIRIEMEKTYHVEEHKIDNLNASYGIAYFPDDGNNTETLMSRAEIACRHAKNNESDNIRCFSKEMNIHTLDKFKFEIRLKGALDRNEMALYYQAKVDTVTEQVMGYEALIRWHDPKHGTISPIEFIPLAEETGLIIPIGEWVIWSACKQLAWLQESSAEPLKISVNISSLQFRQSNLVGIVRQALDLFEVNPQSLDLELTESAVMDNVDVSIGILNDLKNLGVSISIDDFGTGYSSLSYLKRFPIDTLKIDRSFIIELTKNTQDKSIVMAIIALAKSLGLETVAEGVETIEQLHLLREMECDVIQGYYFSKPKPAKSAFAHVS